MNDEIRMNIKVPVRVDQTRKYNTHKALRELFRLYHNSNYVAKRITEEDTIIQGFTRLCISELSAALEVIRSRYGYYCSISYTYDPCQMCLRIDVKERKVDEQ